MTNTAQCPLHATGHDGRSSCWHPASSTAKTTTNGLAPRPSRWVVFRFILAMLLAIAGTGCTSLRAMWRGEHYVISLCQVVDGRFAQERLLSVTPPDGVAVKCKISPLFTSHDIVAVEKVMTDKTVATLRLTLTPENNMRWLQLQQELRDGAIAVIIDHCACLAICPITSATFAENGIIQLTGTFEPSLLDQVVKHAETNYALKKMKEW